MGVGISASKEGPNSLGELILKLSPKKNVQNYKSLFNVCGKSIRKTFLFLSSLSLPTIPPHRLPVYLSHTILLALFLCHTLSPCLSFSFPHYPPHSLPVYLSLPLPTIPSRSSYITLPLSLPLTNYIPHSLFVSLSFPASHSLSNTIFLTLFPHSLSLSLSLPAHSLSPHSIYFPFPLSLLPYLFSPLLHSVLFLRENLH